MRTTIFKTPDIEWEDFENPSKDEMESLCGEIAFPKALVKDALNPLHLPKFERFQNNLFLIMRHFDFKAPKTSDSLRTLTRKISIIVLEKKIITIHRSSSPLIKECVLLLEADKSLGFSTVALALFLIRRCWSSFDILLEGAEQDLEKFEAEVFEDKSRPSVLKQIHIMSRRLSLTKRLLLHSLTTFQRISFPTNDYMATIQDCKETADHLIFFSDELGEDSIYLINLHLALASYSTGEVMRVLTLFSVFFMPLTFIVGIYGMNFAHMPELHWEYGYAITWAVMALVCISIGIWFYRKGWFR